MSERGLASESQSVLQDKLGMIEAPGFADLETTDDTAPYYLWRECPPPSAKQFLEWRFFRVF
jgi:hypothetical protein